MQTINKKNIPETITLKIEKLSNLGLGIAKLDGYVIFVETACPGDIVKVRVGKKNKNFANAKVIEIIEPSPHRVEPFCPMQKVCGACQLQFIDYNYQLELKNKLLKMLCIQSMVRKLRSEMLFQARKTGNTGIKFSTL